MCPLFGKSTALTSFRKRLGRRTFRVLFCVSMTGFGRRMGPGTVRAGKCGVARDGGQRKTGTSGDFGMPTLLTPFSMAE